MKTGKKPPAKPSKKALRQKAEEMFSIDPKFLYEVMTELYEDYKLGKMALKAEKSGRADKNAVLKLLHASRV